VRTDRSTHTYTDAAENNTCSQHSWRACNYATRIATRVETRLRINSASGAAYVRRSDGEVHSRVYNLTDCVVLLLLKLPSAVQGVDRCRPIRSLNSTGPTCCGLVDVQFISGIALNELPAPVPTDRPPRNENTPFSPQFQRKLTRPSDVCGLSPLSSYCSTFAVSIRRTPQISLVANRLQHWHVMSQLKFFHQYL